MYFLCLDTRYLFLVAIILSHEGVSERALYGRLYGHDGVLLCI
jgi:hypothetical protein